VDSKGQTSGQTFSKTVVASYFCRGFHMFRSGNSNTTGTYALDEAELNRASISTFLHREEEGEGLSARGAEPPEYITTAPSHLSGSMNTPAPNYIPKKF
jgi:hypothetical protein